MKSVSPPPQTPACPGVGTALLPLVQAQHRSPSASSGALFYPGPVHFCCDPHKPPGLAGSLRKHAHRMNGHVHAVLFSHPEADLSRHRAPSSSQEDTCGDGPVVRGCVKDGVRNKFTP